VARELTEVAGARALDARTVEIVSRAPDPLLPRRLSLIYPPSPGAWAKLGRDGFARAPVGTGPYALHEATPNRLRLRAAAGSWRRAPTDRLEFLALPEPSARRAALTTGAIDLAPSSISADQFVDLVAEGGQVIVDRVPAVVALAFNTVKDPRFADARVRRALTMAVDREAIVAALLGGKTRVAAQPAPYGTFGFNESLEPLPYDPDAARALLAEAGHEGLAFEMEVPTGAVLYPDVFQQVASDLARIGVRMTVNVIAQQTLLERIQSGGWTGAAAAIPFFTPIADALYPMRQHSCLWHAPWYCDEDAAIAIAAAFAEADPEARRILTERVMKRAHDDAQALFLYETAAFMGAGPRIAHVPIDFGFIRYEGIRFTALGPAPAARR
jgi:peptide/nickel transport system substrate-binding protein